MLIHESNICLKIRKNYKQLSALLTQFKTAYYDPFKQAMESIVYANKDINDFNRAAQLLTDYYREAKSFADTNKITAQSKFLSTILEEINHYLFSSLAANLNYKEYNSKVFAGLVFDQNDEIVLNEKNVDYCVGKELKIKVSRGRGNDKNLTIKKPIIAVEVKTYMDATMFSGILTFSGDLKRGSPDCKTYVLMGYKNIDEAHIRFARGSTDLDEIFVLCADDNFVFDGNALLEYYEEIERAINNYAAVIPTAATGRLLNN